jgi:hypothetical protein
VLGSASTPSFDGLSAIVWPAGAGATTPPTFLPCYSGSACGPNENTSTAAAANIFGGIVGTQNKNGVSCSSPQFGCAVPTIWPGTGSPIEVGTVTGTGIDVSSSGAILWSDATGYHLSSGSTTQLITCLGAVHVNGSGTVIGNTPGPVVSPAYWAAGKCTTLPLLASTPSSAGGAAEAINDQGVIVGRSGASGSSTAVEWISGKAVNLNTLLPPNSGWVLTAPT